MYYKGYFITGDERFGYVFVAPYGAFSPQVFSMIIEAKRAINEDIKALYVFITVSGIGQAFNPD